MSRKRNQPDIRNFLTRASSRRRLDNSGASDPEPVMEVELQQEMLEEVEQPQEMMEEDEQENAPALSNVILAQPTECKRAC